VELGKAGMFHSLGGRCGRGKMKFQSGFPWQALALRLTPLFHDKREVGEGIWLDGGRGK